MLTANWTVPDWLVPILQQFPIVTLALGTFFIGVWWLNRRHREELERNEGRHTDGLRRADAEIARAKADQDAIRETHRSELGRLKELYLEQIRMLQDRIRELEKKSPGRKSP